MPVTKISYSIYFTLLFGFAATVAAAPGKAKFIAQFVPSHMETGTQYEIMLQFKNTGRSDWSQNAGYQLHAVGNDQPWQIDPIPLGTNGTVVAPGDIATFKFKLTAPMNAGSYPFQWQLKQHGKPLAGDKSPLVNVEVQSARNKRQAEFVMQTLPNLINEGPAFSILKTGQVFPVKIVYKNTGVTTWQPDQLRLIAQNPDRNLTWMIDVVEPASKDPVAPGEFATFEFSVNAPTSPGIYDFQWRLYEKGIGNFGEKTRLVKVTVK